MNYLTTEFAPKPELEYPFKFKWSPEHGEPFEVAPGVFWLRMPLPISLDHINLWLLKDHDGWTIVDCGLGSPVCEEVWEIVFEHFMSPQDVKRIIVTHFHPDHIGLAAWLAERCDVKVHISVGEYRLYRSILTRDSQDLETQARSYLTELNFPEDFHDRLISFFSADEKPANKRVTKDIVEFMCEGDVFDIGGSLWRIVCGNGHSPEHCCLYNKEHGVLISGDQAIPRISSNVSVYLANRHDDPLGDWISSCEKLRDTIPNDTLVLPSHQEPFKGLQERMQQLIDDHHAQLNRLRISLKENVQTIDQLRKVMFDRKLSSIDVVLATGETQAHMNYLLHRKEVHKELDSRGAAHYHYPLSSKDT
ncbi:MAG TPA: MBL fold metallo-hydrolase [Gammaproteobacteria bacterium]|nr:MBL fold metallo-hydrolase [Gammaproteobacteria bacterium]